MLRNLASSLFLTERDAEFDANPPKVKGRVVTTLQKAKEVRPLVEKCITIARKSLKHARAAEEFAPIDARRSDGWQRWRNSPEWQKWCAARAPVVAARRRALQLLGDKQAVEVLFDEIAPRFDNRNGGYTRILRLAKPRLGDAGTRAILEFVGNNDRVTRASERPAFDDVDDEEREGQVADDESFERDEDAALSPDDAGAGNAGAGNAGADQTDADDQPDKKE